MFLERKSVDTRELTSKAVSGEGVVGTRGVITTSIGVKERRIISNCPNGRHFGCINGE